MTEALATIVVVDDNPATRYTTSRVLRKEGFEVLEAATGADALELAERRPDLIVLDVELPDMDGFEVCRQLRRRRATARTPVLHVSAVYMRDRDKVEGVDSGADGYMTHPVDPPVLVATVNAFLRARRAEDALRASEAKLVAIFERSPSGIAALSRGMVFLDVNPAVCRQLGRTSGEIVGKHVSAFLPRDSEGAFLSAVDAVETGGAWTGRFPVIRADGRTTFLEWHISTSLPDTRLLITTDITERMRADAEREHLLQSERVARAEAERANRAKDEFLAVLSHELRTPLNAIIGWSHVLRMEATGSPPEVLRATAAIERNAQVQTQLIADLLDISRIASGKLALDRQPLDLAAVVGSALSSLSALAQDREVTIRSELPTGSAQVLWDHARLTQVVWNLVGNAVKFSNRGGEVRVAVRDEDGTLVLEVADRGRGITPQFLPHIFDRFRQEDTSITRSHGGLGLGLSVVNHLVDAHGGTVTAESAGEGLGATFRVTFEHEGHVRDPRRAPSADVRFPGVRVLVVEDDPDARSIIVRVLGELAVDVRECADAESALAALETYTPDLVISDIGMGGADGYEMMRRIRASGFGAATLPAIALTAYGGELDRIRALDAGFQKHLVKPVRAADLKAAAASLLLDREP